MFVKECTNIFLDAIQFEKQNKGHLRPLSKEEGLMKLNIPIGQKL
jgi:hypothetical protein